MDINKFNLNETVNNKDGKTSASGVGGILIILTGILSFISGVVGLFIGVEHIIELFPYIITYIGIGGTLLGIRKLKKEDK